MFLKELALILQMSAIVNHNGRAYQCLRCMGRDGKQVIGRKQRVEEHILKTHLSLDQVPYYCRLCLFRSTSKHHLLSHVAGYKPHARMVLEKGITDSSPCLVQNPRPYVMGSDDFVVYSKEDSSKIFAGRAKSADQDLLGQVVQNAIRTDLNLEDMLDLGSLSSLDEAFPSAARNVLPTMPVVTNVLQLPVPTRTNSQAGVGQWISQTANYSMQPPILSMPSLESSPKRVVQRVLPPVAHARQSQHVTLPQITPTVLDLTSAGHQKTAFNCLPEPLDLYSRSLQERPINSHGNLLKAAIRTTGDARQGQVTPMILDLSTAGHQKTADRLSEPLDLYSRPLQERPRHSPANILEPAIGASGDQASAPEPAAMQGDEDILSQLLGNSADRQLSPKQDYSIKEYLEELSKQVTEAINHNSRSIRCLEKTVHESQALIKQQGQTISKLSDIIERMDRRSFVRHTNNYRGNRPYQRSPNVRRSPSKESELNVKVKSVVSHPTKTKTSRR